MNYLFDIRSVFATLPATSRIDRCATFVADNYRLQLNGKYDETVLIEKTSKKLKLYEFVITALLFITLLTGFGTLYIAIPLAIAVWSITGLCLIAFVGIRIAIWWYHG